jgi:hypothetical protein
MLKKCSVCGLSKEDTEFRKGHNQCKKCSYEKQKECNKEYRKSPKGKETRKRYQKSPKYKEAKKRYRKSPKYKEAKKRYYKRKRQLGFNKLIDHVSDKTEKKV